MQRVMSIELVNANASRSTLTTFEFESIAESPGSTLCIIEESFADGMRSDDICCHRDDERQENQRVKIDLERRVFLLPRLKVIL